MMFPKKLTKFIEKNDIRGVKWKLQVFPNSLVKIKIDIPVLKSEFEFIYKQISTMRNYGIKNIKFEDYAKNIKSVGLPEAQYYHFDKSMRKLIDSYICTEENKLQIDSFEIKSVFFYGYDKGFEKVFYQRIEIEAYATEDYMSRLL
jgi:hypothetical protein